MACVFSGGVLVFLPVPFPCGLASLFFAVLSRAHANADVGSLLHLPFHGFASPSLPPPTQPLYGGMMRYREDYARDSQHPSGGFPQSDAQMEGQRNGPHRRLRA